MKYVAYNLPEWVNSLLIIDSGNRFVVHAKSNNHPHADIRSFCSIAGARRYSSVHYGHEKRTGQRIKWKQEP